jgi:hypothetical protein
MNGERPVNFGERGKGRTQYSILQWATACAATLEISRRAWRLVRDRMPRGDGRRSFVVPAAAITAAFLAGAWWLTSRSHHEVREDETRH